MKKIKKIPRGNKNVNKPKRRIHEKQRNKRRNKQRKRRRKTRKNRRNRKKLLNKNMPLKEISEITELTTQEIKNLEL